MPRHLTTGSSLCAEPTEIGYPPGCPRRRSRPSLSMASWGSRSAVTPRSFRVQPGASLSTLYLVFWNDLVVELLKIVVINDDVIVRLPVDRDVG